MCGEYVGTADSTDNGGKASWIAEGIAWDVEVTFRALIHSALCVFWRFCFHKAHRLLQIDSR
jgi:hypothetical protein